MYKKNDSLPFRSVDFDIFNDEMTHSRHYWYTVWRHFRPVHWRNESFFPYIRIGFLLGDTFREIERFFLDFDYGIVLLDEIPICILSSFSPSTMGRSGNVHTIKITRGYDSRYSDMKNFRFFAPDITNHITHMHTSFVFSFSSHVTRKLSQEKSSYRLWI